MDDAGHKRWVLLIKVKNGAQRNLGLGAYPRFSLAEAREQAIGNQKMARSGVDPLREKQALTRVQTIPTFAAACSSYISLNRPSWKSDRHADQWAASLAKYAYPLLGDKLVSEITRSHVQALLVLQRRFKEGCPAMHEVRLDAWHGSAWPARCIPASPSATAATHPDRTVPGAAFPAPPGTPAVS